MENTAIQIKNLSIGYRDKQGAKCIAAGLNAAIHSGELTCLLGANGVGKSTLLRTLSGFQPKLSGEISIFGKPLESYSGKELSQTIGIVLTEKVDVRDMTVRDLISLGRNPYTGFWGKLSDEDETIISESVACLKIEELSGRSVHTLSDGERQKMMIAKTLAQETPVIYLDEPTAFLDFPSKVEIMRFLHFLAIHSRKTIFLSTHDLELALQIADKLWLMDKRKGLTVGTPDELRQNGTLENFFRCEGAYFDREVGLFRILREIETV
ncbi:iron(III) ABC transporter ATP-binding protein [Bacteroidia bacterium]|nr:iron(III) ABC transporter ATP-binding protein [Bacteroidia bacterium]